MVTMRNGLDTELARTFRKVLRRSRPLTNVTSMIDLSDISTIRSEIFCFAFLKPWSIPPMKDGSRKGTRKRLQLESAPRQRTVGVYVGKHFWMFRARVKERKSHVRRQAGFLERVPTPLSKRCMYSMLSLCAPRSLSVPRTSEQTQGSTKSMKSKDTASGHAGPVSTTAGTEEREGKARYRKDTSVHMCHC